MKKLLFAVLAFITLAAAAPVAQAGQYAQVYTNRGPVYVHKSQLYGGNYNDNCRSGDRYSNQRLGPLRAFGSRSNYYSRSSSSHYRSHRSHRSSPRFSVSFGF